MLELFHWEDFEEEISVKSSQEVQDISIVFSIAKDWKVEYTKELEKEEDEFCIKLSKEDIDMFEPWKYIGILKVKVNGKTKKKEFPISVNSD